MDYARQSATTNGTGFSDNQQRRKYTMKNEVKKYLEQVKREKLKPLVEEVVCAVDRYNNAPSIPNGSRMGDARSKLYAALQETA